MDDVAQLRADLEGLRSRVRVMGWAATLAGLVLAGILGSSLTRSPQESLTVRELVLVDEAGTVRGAWRTTGLGHAQLLLADPSGSPRMSLMTGEGHATLEMMDAGQRTLMRLSAVEDRTALHLARAGGGETAQLRVGEATASLILANHDHSLSAQLRADVEGTDLSLARTPEGDPPRAAVLTAGPAAVEHGPGLSLLAEEQSLEASVDAARGGPRLVLAGDHRLESRIGPDGLSWVELERTEASP
jgi:hypothetical protein